MEFSSRKRLAMVGGGVLAATLFWGSASYAQSLGDVARQERERRKQEPLHSIYVYTNDDLRKEHILIPEDRERVFAARKNEVAPEIRVQNAELPALPVPSPVPFIPIAPSEALVLEEELRVAAEALSPLPIKVVVRTTSVVHPGSNIRTQAEPSTPPADALLASLAPHRSVHHRDTKPMARPAHVETRTPHTEPSIASVRVVAVSSALHAAPSVSPAAALPAASTTHQAVQRRETKQTVTLIRFEKKTSDAAPGVPSHEQEEAAKVPTVQVEHGDSLWRLAKRHLGTGTRWRELAELNPEISNPGFIRVGDWIRLPNA